MEKICISIFYSPAEWTTLITKCIYPFLKTLRRSKCIRHEMIYFNFEHGENIRIAMLFADRPGDRQILDGAIDNIFYNLRCYPAEHSATAACGDHLFLPFPRNEVVFNLFTFGDSLNYEALTFKSSLSSSMMKFFSHNSYDEPNILLFLVKTYAILCFEYGETYPGPLSKKLLEYETNTVFNPDTADPNYMLHFAQVLHDNEELLSDIILQLFSLKYSDKKTRSVENRMFQRQIHGKKGENIHFELFDHTSQMIFNHIGVSRNLLPGVLFIISSLYDRLTRDSQSLL